MNGRTNSTSTSDIGIIDIPLDPPTSFVCEARNSKVDITWVDPKDKYATPEGEQMEDTDQLVSVWAYTKIVRKEGSQPSSPSDGITVYTSDIRNQHQSAIYEDIGVTNGVTYYYAAYAYNTDGVYSDGAFSSGVTPIEWSTVLSENSWEQIDSACTQGVAQSLWEIGDEHPITVSNQNLTAVIIDFNHDNLADGSGKAVMTFSTNTVMASSKYRNQYIYDALDNITTVLTNLNSTDLISHIKSVTKAEYWVGHGVSNLSNKNRTWFAFNIKELNVDPENVSTSGDTITDSKYGEPYEYFSIQSNRRKPDDVWTSTEYAYSTYHGQWINMDNGDIQVSSPQSLNYSRASLCPGFCIGKVAV